MKKLALFLLLLSCNACISSPGLAAQQSAQPSAQTTPGTQPSPQNTQPLSESLIRWIFTVGIVCITVSWITIPFLFAHQGKLEELLDLLRRGTVMRFVTVTYIVLVVVVLALIGRLEGDKVSTLLGSIAGYVLGQATNRPPDKGKGAGTGNEKGNGTD